MFSKKGLAVCDQVLDKAEKSPQWEKKLHPVFSWGAAVIIQSVGVLKPCGQTPPFYGSDWLTDWERPKERGDKLSFVRVVGQVLSGTGQLLFYQLQPPPLPSTTTTTLPLHMLTGHMLIQLVNMTVNAPIEKKRLLQHRAPLCYRQFGLSQAGCLRPCLCVNCRLIWQALSCTSSIPTQQHSQIELALDSEWSERLNWTKRGEKQ